MYYTHDQYSITIYSDEDKEQKMGRWEQYSDGWRWYPYMYQSTQCLLVGEMDEIRGILREVMGVK